MEQLFRENEVGWIVRWHDPEWSTEEQDVWWDLPRAKRRHWQLKDLGFTDVKLLERKTVKDPDGSWRYEYRVLD